MGVAALPHVNALINTAVAILLVVGLVLIKRGKRIAHQKVMTAALILSALFLCSYLVYHYQHGSTKFTGIGPVRTVYFTLLSTHTVLAVVNLPFIVIAVARAWRGEFAKHRRIARVTWYMWFYVAMTGPLVYLMLYQLYPASRLEEELDRARAIHETGNERAALALYRQLAEVGHPGAKCFAAVVADRIEKTELARATLEKTLKEHPGDVSCLVLEGRELVYEQQLDRAIPILEKAVELAPKDAFTHESLAFAYFRKYEYRKAARAFERAVELQPEKALHRGNAGYAHYHYGNYATARPHLAKALELGLDPEFAERVQEALGVIDGRKWICPMHPHVSGARGEKCSECGMPLEPAPESPVTE
jgi:uncharacterized membrane protein YozB (DUF420 family)/Flp pilus assembly protein TadD